MLLKHRESAFSPTYKTGANNEIKRLSTRDELPRFLVHILTGIFKDCHRVEIGSVGGKAVARQPAAFVPA
jgi:hypothetical protein